MAHKEQQQFVQSVKDKYPRYFNNVSVVDIGSLDVNGNNRMFFSNYSYVGVDLSEGRNVDVIQSGHLYKPDNLVDVVISTECLEHDPYYRETMRNMYNMLKKEGMLIITAASTGRGKHGPGPIVDGEEYYRNITLDDFIEVFELEWDFSFFNIQCEYKSPILSDIRFYGIKAV